MHSDFPAKPVRLVGVASCWGARDKACDVGPDVLRALDIGAGLGHRLDIAWQEILRPRADDVVLKLVIDLYERLAQSVRDLVVKQHRFAVFGGDHSCAIGTWNGAAHALGTGAPVGLLWIDAHMDAHTPETSPSGALHGMPLACLLGHGIKALCDLGRPRATLLPQHVCLVGVRSYEAGERALLEALGVRIYYMEEIRRRGLPAVMQEARAIVTNGTVGFGVSIDLDALDPIDAPGVGSPEPGGLRRAELVDALDWVRREQAFLGVEIAEFNPSHDIGDKTAWLTRDLVAALL